MVKEFKSSHSLFYILIIPHYILLTKIAHYPLATLHKKTPHCKAR